MTTANHSDVSVYTRINELEDLLDQNLNDVRTVRANYSYRQPVVQTPTTLTPLSHELTKLYAQRIRLRDEHAELTVLSDTSNRLRSAVQ